MNHPAVQPVYALSARAAAPFIGVLQVRDGQITRWREYQDAVAMAQALGQLPALLGRPAL